MSASPSVCSASRSVAAVCSRAMEQWCWLERNLGLLSIAATKKCAAYNFTGTEAAPSAGTVRKEWLDTANTREEQRKECRRRTKQPVCELTFRGSCYGTPSMSSTPASPRVVQYAVTASGKPDIMCRRRVDAWQRTCRSVAVVSGRVVFARATVAECGGKWQAGGVRIVHPPPPPPPPHVETAAAVSFQGSRPANTPDPFPVYKPARCDARAGQGNSRIPLVLWQTGRGNDRRAHNNASARAAQMANALMEGGGLQLVWHNDSMARDFVARECPLAIRAYDCLRPQAYKAPLPTLTPARAGAPLLSLTPARAGGPLEVLCLVPARRALPGRGGRAPRAAAGAAAAV